jgi:lantibiotic modifying enzyme
MSDQSITRREMLAMSVGAASTFAALPSVFNAIRPRRAPASDLDMAIAAARWIRRSRVETKSGIVWRSDPANAASVGFDLFAGAPGIVLFNLELYEATRDTAWLDDAKLGANEIIANLPSLQRVEASGLYDGLAGAAFVLEQTHRVTGDGKYRDAARRAIGMIHALAHRTISGAEWAGRSDGPDIVSGAAGIGLLLLWADAIMDDGESRTIALATGRRLLETGKPAGGGLKWESVSEAGRFYPNFGYGTGGVAYFLAEVFRVSGDRSCMAGALSGARYLESIANTDGGGFKLFHHEPGGEAIYESGWCNGPAGTARLFEELGIVTGRAKWHDQAHACARSILQADVAGVDLCNGAAGVAEFLISLQQKAAEPSYATTITKLSQTIRDRAIADGGGVRWPDGRTGYMDGAAGIGMLFLHLDAMAKKRTSGIVWPDSPWARPCAETRAKVSRDMSDVNSNIGRGC